MLSHFAAFARVAGVVLCASVLVAACGIKGPLKLPPKADPAAKSDAPAKGDAATPQRAP
jgi:predicted small lipoprotein YifL